MSLGTYQTIKNLTVEQKKKEIETIFENFRGMKFVSKLNYFSYFKSSPRSRFTLGVCLVFYQVQEHGLWLYTFIASSFLKYAKRKFFILLFLIVIEFLYQYLLAYTFEGSLSKVS